MTNRKLIVMVLMCLVAHQVSAMKRAVSGVAESEKPFKRVRVEGVEELDMRTDRPFTSVVSKVKKPDVFEAIKEKDFYGFSSMVASGTDPNKCSSADDNSLLMNLWLSAFTPEQKKEGYRLLQSCGADINVGTSNTQATLAHFVSLEGDGKFFDQLMKDGANVHAEDWDGDTPLFYARNAKMTARNVHYGADVNHQNFKGQTALFRMTGPGDARNAKALVLLGADCEIQDDKERTAYELYKEKQGRPNAAIKNNQTARDKIIMPTFVEKRGNPVLFVHNRAITGRPMSNQQLVIR